MKRIPGSTSSELSRKDEGAGSDALGCQIHNLHLAATLSRSLPRWEEVLTGVHDTVDTVVCGHTHMPFLRLVDRRLVVNLGSVGMPFGPRALGAVPIWLRHFAPHRNESPYPDREEWAIYFLPATASDTEAIGDFVPATADQRSELNIRFDGHHLWCG